MRLLFLSFACLLLIGCSTVASTVYGDVPDSHKVLFWSQDKRDVGFRSAEDYTEVKTIKAGANISPLPLGSPIVTPKKPFTDRLIDQFIDRQDIAGLIVLKDGEVVLEKYARDFDENGRWTSFSMAKSFTSTLVGAAIKDGYIKSLDDKITQYIPNLTGSAYDDVTVRQLLTMTSGVKWSEDYANPWSDVASFIRQKPEPGFTQTVSYMRKLKKEARPGTKWKYKTGETNLLGVLVSQATGKTLSEYLSEKIWKPYGMERDALWAVDLSQHEMGGCCLSASLRDYARYGQFMLDGSRIDGHSIFPAGWVEDATSVQEDVGEFMGYGYQWWTFKNGNYMAQGLFGQMIFVNPKSKIVVVMVSNWPKIIPSKKLIKDRLLFLLWIEKATKKDTDMASVKP